MIVLGVFFKDISLDENMALNYRQNNWILYFLLLEIIVFSGIKSDEPSKIIGGTRSGIRRNAFMASLRMFGTYICGGAIISPYHILTAAHCILKLDQLYKIEKHTVTVLTGTSNRRNIKGISHNVSSMVHHNEYFRDNVKNLQYDIGLIKLTSPITFNEFQRPIKLPKKAPMPNSLARVLGWGMVDYENQQWPEFLQQTQMMLLTNEMCYQMDNIFNKNSTHTFCAYMGHGKGVCVGDSGSPMVYKNAIIGIVSRGYPCAIGKPDTFTNVYSFLDYIEKRMADMI